MDPQSWATRWTGAGARAAPRPVRGRRLSWSRRYGGPPARRVGGTGAADVVGDQPEFVGEFGRDGIPHAVVIREAVHQHDRPVRQRRPVSYTARCWPSDAVSQVCVQTADFVMAESCPKRQAVAPRLHGHAAGRRSPGGMQVSGVGAGRCGSPPKKRRKTPPSIGNGAAAGGALGVRPGDRLVVVRCAGWRRGRPRRRSPRSPAIDGTKPTSMPSRITCASSPAVPSVSQIASPPVGQGDPHAELVARRRVRHGRRCPVHAWASYDVKGSVLVHPPDGTDLA